MVRTGSDADELARSGAFPVMSAAGGEAIHRLLKRLPQWLRADLASTDPLQRERAEDALFAMMMACLEALDRPHDGEPA